MGNINDKWSYNTGFGTKTAELGRLMDLSIILLDFSDGGFPQCTYYMLFGIQKIHMWLQ